MSPAEAGTSTNTSRTLTSWREVGDSMGSAMVGRRSSHVVQGKMKALVLELVREDLSALLPAGARRDGTTAFLAGALFELLIWSLEAKPPTTAEAADALFQELAAPALARARLPGASGQGRAEAR